MFYTYVLLGTNDHWYIGFTTDLRRRVKEHNQGSNFSTRPHRPLTLVYYGACLDRTDAERREKYLKTTQGGRLLKRRLKEYTYKMKSEKKLESRNSTTGYG